MTEKILILGGARSGKSGFALSLASKLARRGNAREEKGLYIATAKAYDKEMSTRIRLHKAQRGDSWKTVEETMDLAKVLNSISPRCPVIVIDCLTLWLVNIMLDEGKDFHKTWVRPFLSALEDVRCPVVMVSNEVGMGIVPDTSLGRDFRDQAGLLHQELARVCDQVILVVAGLPLYLKQEGL